MDAHKEELRGETYFAPAERADKALLERNIESISRNPIIAALMEINPGLLAVLNEQRQILAVNETLLDLLGIGDAYKVFGLRIGEALQCIHAHDHRGGCGTSKSCSTCGAAIAIVTALAQNRPVKRECMMTVEEKSEQKDFYFQVQCCPASFSGERFLMLFLRDMTIQQQQAILERVFFHDVRNLISALVLNAQLFDYQGDVAGMRKLGERVKILAAQVEKEVEIQQALSFSASHDFQFSFQDVSVEMILMELQTILSRYAVAETRLLSLPESIPSINLYTDPWLLQRILINMVINALEATAEGGTVRFWIEAADHKITFCVWNQGAIPELVAQRIFQRNFSTKPGSGRGAGTYVMKLFGETYLKGKVDFVTSEEGTTFRLSLPL